MLRNCVACMGYKLKVASFCVHMNKECSVLVWMSYRNTLVNVVVAEPQVISQLRFHITRYSSVFPLTIGAVLNS